MKFDVKDEWLLPFLSVVHVRPGMYLGDESVRTLATYISGYCQAREDLGRERYVGKDKSLLDDFGPWLKVRLGSRKELTWVGYIQEADATEKNVGTFFALFRHFLSERGESMPDPEAAARLWPVHRPFTGVTAHR